MTVHDLERAIWRECQGIVGRSMRFKDLREWRAGAVSDFGEDVVRSNMEEGERYVWCPSLKMHCAVRTTK